MSCYRCLSISIDSRPTTTPTAIRPATTPIGIFDHVQIMMGEGAVHRRVVQRINHPVVLHRQGVRHAARDPARRNQIQILIVPERPMRVICSSAPYQSGHRSQR